MQDMGNPIQGPGNRVRIGDRAPHHRNARLRGKRAIVAQGHDLPNRKPRIGQKDRQEGLAHLSGDARDEQPHPNLPDFVSWLSN
jgi:hypothetical protein